jgi:hypothetical protein
VSGPTNYINARHVVDCWKVTTGVNGETFTLDNPIIAWENGPFATNNLSAYWYDDAAQDWNPIRATTDTFGGPGTTDDGRVSIAATCSSGVCFAHFVWHGTTATLYNLYYARWNWNTHNFDIAPKQIATLANYNYVFPTVVNRNNGEVWVFFERQNAASTPDNIYEIHSLDRGKSWSTPFQVNSGGIILYAGWPLITAAAAHSAPRNESGNTIMRGPSNLHIACSTKSSASDSSWDIYHWWKLADESVTTAWHQEVAKQGSWTPTQTNDLMFPSITVDAHGIPHIAYLNNYGYLIGYSPSNFYQFGGTVYYGKRLNPAGSSTGPTQWSFAPFYYPELDSIETPPTLAIDFDNTVHMSLALGDTAIYSPGPDTLVNWEAMYTFYRKGDGGFPKSLWFFDLHASFFGDSIYNALWPQLMLEPSDLGPGLLASYINSWPDTLLYRSAVVYEGWDANQVEPTTKAAIHALSVDSLKNSVGRTLKATISVHNFTGAVQSYTDSIYGYVAFPGTPQYKGKIAISTVGANMRKSTYSTLSASLPANARNRKITILSKLFNSSWQLLDTDTCDFYVRP